MLGDRVLLLEAQLESSQYSSRSVRHELDRNKQRRAFKPIHPNYEKGRAYFVGHEDMIEMREQQEQEDEVETAGIERKRAKKEQAVEE